MNIIYQHFSIISCRFSNEATIPVSYRFLIIQFEDFTIHLELIILRKRLNRRTEKWEKKG